MEQRARKRPENAAKGRQDIRRPIPSLGDYGECASLTSGHRPDGVLIVEAIQSASGSQLKTRRGFSGGGTG